MDVSWSSWRCRSWTEVASNITNVMATRPKFFMAKESDGLVDENHEQVNSHRVDRIGKHSFQWNLSSCRMPDAKQNMCMTCTQGKRQPSPSFGKIDRNLDFQARNRVTDRRVLSEVAATAFISIIVTWFNLARDAEREAMAFINPAQVATYICGHWWAPRPLTLRNQACSKAVIPDVSKTGVWFATLSIHRSCY